MIIGGGGAKIIYGAGLPDDATKGKLYASDDLPLLYSGQTGEFHNVNGVELTFPTTGKTENAITGTPQVDEVLTSDEGTWSGTPDVYYYQWGYYDDSTFTALTGQTASTYTVVADDVGHLVTCRVWAGDTVTSFSYYLLSEYHQATAVEIV